MKNLLVVFLSSVCVFSHFLTADESQLCACKNCRCSSEKHCGCFDNKNCSCSKECECAKAVPLRS